MVILGRFGPLGLSQQVTTGRSLGLPVSSSSASVGNAPSRPSSSSSSGSRKPTAVKSNDIRSMFSPSQPDAVTPVKQTFDHRSDSNVVIID